MASAGSRTKLLFIICDQGFEPDVMRIMQKHGIAHYTRWTDCQGAGTTGRKEGTPIWPGLNTVIMIVLPEEAIEPLRADLHAARDTFPVTPGLKMIVTDAEIF